MPLEYQANGQPVWVDERGNVGAVEFDDQGNPHPAAARQQPAPAQPPRRSRDFQGAQPWQQQVSGVLASINRGIPFANDISAIGRGVENMAQGRPFQQGYQSQRDFQHAAQTNIDQTHPLASNFITGSAAVAPVIATAGASAPQAAVSTARGLPLWLSQTGRGAAAGSAYGALYGAGTSEGDLPQRLEGANQGALFGGLFGGATPTAVNAAGAVFKPASSAIMSLLNRVEVDPSRVGAMGGNLRVVPPSSGRGPTIPPAAIGTIDRLTHRAGMTADELGQRIETVRANPQGEVLADTLGEPGVMTTRAIAQAPGETGQAAFNVQRERVQAAPARIVSSLQRLLGVGESRTAALNRLGDEYQSASANLYRPVINQPTTPEMTQRFRSDLGDVVMSDPVMQDAEKRAQRIFARDARLGLVQGGVQDNLPRYLHYVKMGLDDAIGAARRDPTGIQATEMRGVMALRNRFVTAMDDIVPGYRQARQTWGGLANAEEALTEGADFIRMRPEEVQARVAEMTPFELHHARIGLVDEIRHMTRGGVNRNVNIARVLDDPEMQQSIAATFDNPQQAEQFLSGVNTQYRLLDNASRWRGGSSTWANLTHGGDEAMNTALEAGGHAARGNLPGAGARVVGGVWNAMRLGAVERENNQRGAALLQRIDGPEAKVFTDEVIRLLRQREAARTAATRVSAVGARAAGTGQGRRRQ